MFSVVIPLFNKEKEIVRTLDSVLSQSLLPDEIVIVDDGSKDGSAEAVRKVQSEYAGPVDIRLVRKENGGVCSARNRGIKEAGGDYIALLDADDAWDKDYLVEQKRMIEDFPGCAMWGINFAELRDGKPIRYLPTGLPEGFRGVVEDYFGHSSKGRVSDLFCSSSVVIRKTAFEKAGYFDERIRYSEDIDQWWRIIALFPVAFYDRYMVRYYYDASNRAMEKARPLDRWLPYYVGKYSSWKGIEPFYTYAQRWCAVRLKEIYFNDPRQRELARRAFGQLDFDALPSKYRIYFKFPFAVAAACYRIKK